MKTFIKTVVLIVGLFGASVMFFMFFEAMSDTSWKTYRPSADRECVVFYEDYNYKIKCYLLTEVEKMSKTNKPPTYEQAMTWVKEEYQKSLSTGRVTKELLVAQALVIKIHELQTEAKSAADTIIEHK